ncbi:MAG: AAA family ATPase [Thermodesulfobacteriota bacterium]
MIVKSLVVSHFKGARDVEILDPSPVCVEVAGKNAAGKSSVLESIVVALGGKRMAPAEPITHGEDRAEIVLSTDDFTVNRTFRRVGDEIKTGLKIIPNTANGDLKQRDLDVLLSNFAFDPLRFASLKPAEQIDQLKRLAGDETCKALAQIEADISGLEQERLEIGQALKVMGDVRDVDPAEPVDVAALVAERDEIEAFNREQVRLGENIEAAEEAVKQAREKVEGLRRDLEAAEADLAAKQATLDGLPFAEEPKPLDEINARLAQVNEINAKAQAYQEYLKKARRHKEYADKYDTATDEIKALRKQRAETFAAAELPLPGLKFSADGGELIYNGTPFSQLSSAERYRVSAAIGMASLPPVTSDRPALRLMMIKDGSLLDGDSFQALTALAQEYGCQLLVETVGEGHGDAIMIEEGEVVSLAEWRAKHRPELAGAASPAPTAPDGGDEPFSLE